MKNSTKPQLLALLTCFIVSSFFTANAQCVVVPDQNTVVGTVFTDTNQNGSQQPFETGLQNIGINLYQDINGNGIVDVDDVLVDSAISAADGTYTLVPPEITFSENVADFFNGRKFDGNNGSEDWSGDWVEIGENDGPRFGNVSVANALRFGRASFFNDVLDGDGVYRVADLTSYTTATLSFDFRDFVSFPSAQYFSVDVEVSTDGVTYTTLDSFTFFDTDQSYSYDLTPYISSTTYIRFIANGFMQNFRSNYLYFDNVTIDYEKEGFYPDYIVAIDDTTIPNGTSLTTPSFNTVTFTDIGQISCDHDFGFFTCAGSCAPEAVDDAASLDQGTSQSIDVLINDVAGNNNIDPTSVTIVSQPSFGSATVTPAGEIIYAPNGNYFGPDSFTYQVCDDNAFTPLCDTADVSITVLEDVIDACLQAAQNHTYYIPFSDTELRTAFINADSGTCNPIDAISNEVRRITSIKSPYPGIVIIYDHWEDGYETDINNPSQSTTQVWGDNDPINGVAPGYPSDYIPSGGDFVLDNTYNYNPRNPADFFFDGKDKIHTSADIALSTVAGDVNRFAVQAAKTDVYDQVKFGTSFTVPFGEELGEVFSYTSLFIRASKDNTTVNIDLDNDGTIDSTANLDEGDVHFEDGSVLSGSSVTSTEPVGVDLFFGGLDCFGTRQINLFPAVFYSDTYYTPVPTTNVNAPAVAYFYNNNGTDIDIDWESNVNTGTINVPSKTSASITLNDNSAYRFTSQGGESYVASEVIDSDATGSTYDWAFNLISEDRLTDFGAIAWAPGSIDNSVNHNPVWVTPEANTTVYVKFDGDLTSTTALNSPCGIPYDLAVPVNELNYTQIYDTVNNDNDQSGLALYTCDGTRIFAVYGEDAGVAFINSPSIDVGTSIQPLCLQPQIFANDDLAYGLTDTSLNVSVLFNDSKFITNINPASVNNNAVLQPTNGSVSVNPDGTITYIPNSGFTGLDTFEYSVCSLEFPGVCDTATVTIIISDCPTPSNRNLVFGQVYLDADEDMMNNDGIGIENITLNVYEDINTNGVIDGGDLPLATSPTAVTDALGNYQFEVPSYDVTYSDDFSSGNYSGGTTNWASDWTEVGDDGNPNNGDIEIVSGELKVENNTSIYRVIDLADAAYATISFDVREDGSIDINDDVTVQFCSDGTFTNCQTLFFAEDDFPNASINSAVLDTDKLSATSHIRIQVNDYSTFDEEFFIDNISVLASIRGKNILIEADLSTVPSNYALSTDNLETATFPSGFTGVCEKANDFGFVGCNMTDPGIAISCDDNGTPLDATDDTFSFSLNPDGLRFGSTYTVSGDITGSGSYGSPTVFGPYPSVSGPKFITIADETGNCGLVNIAIDSAVSQCLFSNSSTTIDFDGVDDYLDVSPFISNWSEATIMGWVKIESSSPGPLPNLFSIAGQENMKLSLTTARTPAFSVLTQAQVTSSSNFPSNNIQVQPNPLLNISLLNNQWYHITGVFSSTDQTIKLYLNGELVNTVTDPQLNSVLLTENFDGSPHIYSTREFTIGRYPTNTTVEGFGHFDGDIDEVRVLSVALTDDQIQRMVYQEIEQNGSIIDGKIIPKDLQDINTNNTIPWSSLEGYFPMTDVVNSKTTDASGKSRDLTLHNILTIQEQSAPMPYETVNDGLWVDENSWLHGDVWDIEDITNSKPWSIVHIKNDITTAASHTQLGMLIDTDKTLTVTGDNEINNSWYLQLDGTLDLQNDSQLVQGVNSDLVTSATGKILRRQEGNSNVFWYNYWSSPVGTTSATTLTNNNGTGNNTNNTAFNLAMLTDGAGTAMEFTSNWDEVGKISNRWLYSFQNGQNYYGWGALTPASGIAPGVGYTQKGTGVANVNGNQEYIFEGKPNNGTILIAADDVDGDTATESEDGSRTTSLIGNPYPSALDARQFIADNSATIKGTILLWEQWAGNSHILAEYEGGYGYINSMTTERAYQYAGVEIADPLTDPNGEGIKRPTFYIPVGQGFFVEVVEDGNIEFNNGQRVHIKESDILIDQDDPNYGENGSSFFRTTNNQSSQASQEEEVENPYQLIRLEFKTSAGASRRFVLGFSETATDGFDYGLDGGYIDDIPEDDMGSLFEGKQYAIQAFAPITPEKEIDLNLNASGDYSYSIKAVELSNIDENQEVYLRDNLTGTYFDLRGDDAYEFTSAAGTFNDRFDVVFKNNQTLDKDEFEIDNILIYNNRLEHKLYVKGLKEDVKSLKLTNMLGQVVKSFGQLTANTLESGVFLGDLSSGVYMVNVVTDNNLKVDKKIILE